MPELNSDVLRSEVQRWLSARQLVTVRFKENNQPPFDPHDDYKVVYTALLSPPSDQQAMLELHLTDEGWIGIGLEKRARVANRLNVRNHREGYADGFEPCVNNWNEIADVLDIVASGELAIRARVIPGYGLGATGASLRAAEKKATPELLRKFYFSRKMKFGFLIRTVSFQPWR